MHYDWFPSTGISDEIWLLAFIAIGAAVAALWPARKPKRNVNP